MKSDDDIFNSIVPGDQMLPEKLTIVPLAGRPVFPGIFTPLMINAPDDVKAVEEAFYKEGFIGISMLRNDVEKPGINDICKIGTASRIIKKVNLPAKVYRGGFRF